MMDFLTWLDKLIMVPIIMTSIFLTTRYVFLEQGMEPKKQRRFYIFCYVVLALAFVVYVLTDNENFLQPLYILLGGLNIFLGRKKNRVFGFFLIIPLAGIMNGISNPLMMSENFFNFTDARWSKIYTIAMNLLLAMALIVFYFKGKAWRAWFHENMKNRRLLASEYIVLFTSGIAIYLTGIPAQLFLFEMLETQEQMKNAPLISIGYYVLTFLLSVTVVVLILQGNQRKFYNDRVSNMQFSVIATMADIVENRDANTGGHIKRTAKYVEIISQKLKKQNAYSEFLTNQYIADMIVAAPLHDIGKISIPDAILNKPGKLTDEEFTIMKTHTTAGRDVLLQAEGQLGEFDYLETALDMAESHHEWWNGKGYPNGISGEEIPLCARIMAVADVFDALTSKRCYKDAMPLEKAYSIIQEESGTHFDPVVAKAFLDSKSEIEKTIREIADEG